MRVPAPTGVEPPETPENSKRGFRWTGRPDSASPDHYFSCPDLRGVALTDNMADLSRNSVAVEAPRQYNGRPWPTVDGFLLATPAGDSRCPHEGPGARVSPEACAHNARTYSGELEGTQLAKAAAKAPAMRRLRVAGASETK
jgi:hypothetical protein